MLGLALAGPALSDVACDGTVTLGEGSAIVTTAVANRAVGASCLNDLIVDTTAEGAN